ncbi:MAG: GGDEF domain-containing protein [Campylobacterota bacterium]|nr:GGDEF domain-containing protein [Campylobacterota bacterium]
MSSTSSKVFFLIFIMLSSLTLATIINVALNFRTFSKEVAIDKANSIAESVRDGLTAHMVNGTMDKRELFLENMIKHQDVQNLHLFRSKNVIKLFGDGSNQEQIYSELEAKVVNTAQSSFLLKETSDSAIITIVIPYIATKYSNPNCLTCHTNAKEGDVLGVISMDVEIAYIRANSIMIIFKILLISIVFLIIAMFLAKHFIKPYIKLFDDLEEGISKAYRGDFSHYVETNLSDEAGKVASRLNELSEIFRFKKTIELDDNKEIIYNRLAHILMDNFNIKNFVFMEIDSNKQTREVVYTSREKDNLPEDMFGSQANDCRAYRTDGDVLSTEFYQICSTCFKEGCEFLCIPFNINEDYSIVLHIRSNSVTEIEKIKYIEPIIKNYFELAQPILESKYLMNILKEKSLKDGLTGLYNRRYLENLIENTDRQYVVLMIDIDLFKSVNDTYGHDIGDKVIIGLSKFLQNSIKGSDVAIRYGGEEFIVIFYGISIDNAFKIADELRDSFSKIYFETGEENIRKTISIGMATFNADSTVPMQVIKYADRALYQAKNTGRNKVVIFKNNMDNE